MSIFRLIENMYCIIKSFLKGKKRYHQLILSIGMFLENFELLLWILNKMADATDTNTVGTTLVKIVSCFRNAARNHAMFIIT